MDIVRSKENGMVIFYLCGCKIYEYDVRRLRQRIGAELAQGQQKFALDVKNLKADCLDILIRCRQKVRRAGGQMWVANPGLALANALISANICNFFFTYPADTHRNWPEN